MGIDSKFLACMHHSMFSFWPLQNTLYNRFYLNRCQLFIFTTYLHFFLLRKILKQIKAIIKKRAKVEVSYLKFHICQCMCEIHSCASCYCQSLYNYGTTESSLALVIRHFQLWELQHLYYFYQFKKKLGFLSYQKVYSLHRYHFLHLNN